MSDASTARPSSVPDTVTPSGSVTLTTTSVSMLTVVSCCTVGGSAPPSFQPSAPPLSLKNSAVNASAGIAIAVSLSQYWNACTNVIDRIPPATTLVMTIAPTATGPSHTGVPSSVLSASPAPWYCGTR